MELMAIIQNLRGNMIFGAPGADTTANMDPHFQPPGPDDRKRATRRLILCFDGFVILSNNSNPM
jgi:hypothetical protein